MMNLARSIRRHGPHLGKLAGMSAESAPSAEIAQLLARLTPGDGCHATPIDGLFLLRSAKANEAVHAVQEPAVCLVVQGAKRVILGSEAYRYDRARYLVVTAGLPVCGEVLEASPETPYLCVRLDIDAQLVADVVLQAGLKISEAPPARAMYLGEATVPFTDAILRLVRLLLTPQDIGVLAPLAIREIIYRLLTGPDAARLYQIAAPAGHAHRVALAIQWLKSNFQRPMKVEEMARMAHMSPSALHRHFKAVTAVTPLQFQKRLRLQEARRLMLATGLDAATAGWRVGYESASQFSREYRRMFDEAPGRDVQRFRGAR